MLAKARLRRLEQNCPAVDSSQGFFVVGSVEHAEALQLRYQAAGQGTPVCLVTGISREHPIWVPDENLPGFNEAMAALADEELAALIDTIRSMKVVTCYDDRIATDQN